MSWENLSAYHARQFEVAIAGRHAIAIYGAFGDTSALIDVARAFHLSFAVIEPCPCGNYGHSIRGCYCNQDELIHWRKSPAMKALDGFPIIVKPNKGHLNDEGFYLVMNRLQQYERFNQQEPKYDEAAIGLLNAWRKQTGSTEEEIKMIESVAATIDRMNGKSGYSVAALAEAMQYRSKGLLQR